MLAGELWVAVKAKTAAYYRDLRKMEDKTKTTSQRMAASMELYSRRARRALFIIGAAFVGVMKITADAEETVDKFYHVFKEETNDATRWANKFSTSIGRSLTSIMDYMATFQSIFVPLGFARKEARLFSQQMVELAYDVGSLRNVAVDVVARKFQSALVGMSRAVMDLGKNTREFMVKQELERMGLDSTSKSLAQKYKVMARMNLLIRQSKDEHGDLIRTSGSLTNVTRALRDAMKDFSIVLGRVFVPAAKEIIVQLKSWAEALKVVVKEHKKGTLIFIKTAAALLILTAILPTLIALIKTLGVVLLILTAHPVVAMIVATALAISNLIYQTIKLNDAKRTSITLQEEEVELLKKLKKGQKDLNDEQVIALKRKLALNTLRQKTLRSEVLAREKEFGLKKGIKYEPDLSGLSGEALAEAEHFIKQQRTMGMYHPETGKKLESQKAIEANTKANEELIRLTKQELELRAQINIGLQKTTIPDVTVTKAETKAGQWMGIGEVWRGAVSAALKGKNTPEERTAKNTLDTAKATKESAASLKEIAGKQATTGLVFGS